MAQTNRDGRHDALVRRTVLVVALLNLGYFFVEMAVALRIGSVSLFADSVDFLEDASVNLLVLTALGWAAARRRAVGLLLAALILVPAGAALWTVWQKLSGHGVPEPLSLTLTGLGALAVNFFCAVILARVRSHGGSLTKAAYLSARNDVAANALIIAAGLLTAAIASMWPDLIAGAIIAVMNAGAAYEVYEAAMGEHDDDDDLPSTAAQA